MKCPICNSENITLSQRRSIEKLLQYVWPRAPYRCKDCWSRFWQFDNPYKTKRARLLGGLALCCILLLFALPFLLPDRPDSVSGKAEKKVSRPSRIKRTPPSPVAESPSPVATVTDADSAPVIPSSDAADEETDQPPADQEPKQPVLTHGTEKVISSETPAETTETPEVPGTVAEVAPAPEESGAETTADESAVQADAQATSEVAVNQDQPSQDAVDKEKGDTVAVTEKPDQKLLPAEKAPAAKPGSPEKVAEPQPEKIAKVHAPPREAAEKKPAEEKEAFRLLREIKMRAGRGEFRLLLIADGPIREYKTSYIPAPPRQIIDLPGKWKQPNQASPLIKTRSDMVRQIRIGEHAGFIRVVMDLRLNESLSPVLQETPHGLRIDIERKPGPDKE